MTKLIFWLAGLLLAIVTMNVTVYLALSGVYLVIRAGKRMLLAKVDTPRAQDPGRSSRT
jgi:hypothetical protein